MFQFDVVQKAPHNNYVTTNYKAYNIHTDVTMCVCDRESVSLSWNPNDRIEWPRLVLPRRQAPWICDRRKGESGSGHRQPERERDKYGSKTVQLLIM